MVTTRKERIKEYKPAYKYLEDKELFVEARIRTGGAMEFDPRVGETMVPDCIEFKLEEKNEETLQVISDVCDRYGFEVRLPDYKQPDFTYESSSGQEYEKNTVVDYDAFVRLVKR